MINPYFQKFSIESEFRGPLNPYSFGVKSNIQVKGLLSSQGVRKWDDNNNHPVLNTATCVQVLLDSGALFKGTFHTSAFAFDLSGRNSYGTPINPRVLSGVSGGSSSGSASAVALGLVDASLGTDTGGSIRIPASYCGLWSIRTTTGIVPKDYIIATGPSTDVVGLIAKKAKVLGLFGNVLINKISNNPVQKRFLVISDFFDLCSPANREIFFKMLDRLSFYYDLKTATLDGCFKDEKNREHKAINGLQEASLLLLVDTWETISPRLAQHLPNWENEVESLTPEVVANLKLARDTAENIKPNSVKKRELQERVNSYREQLNAKLKKENAVLIIPTVPHSAPNIDRPLDGHEIFKMITMTCLASLLGLPQVQMPIVTDDAQKPLGLSIIGAQSTDSTLLNLAIDIESKIKTQD